MTKAESRRETSGKGPAAEPEQARNQELNTGKEQKQNQKSKQSRNKIRNQEPEQRTGTKNQHIKEQKERKEEKIMARKISTDKAPAAIGPYSQGIVAGGLLFASGQIAINPATGEIQGNDIVTQTEQVMKNIGALLEAAGTGYERVVKTTCFLADMGDFATFNEVYARYFTEKPARSCVAVKTLPKNVLCEVEVVAEVGTDR